MATTVVKLDPTAVAALLRGAQGPVLRHLTLLATQVQDEAKRRVGKDSRQLERSIVKRFVQTPDGPGVEVGSDQPHALLHHEGTRAHEIRPKRAAVLAFPSSKGSSVMVFARVVHHPGTKPNRYLTDSLEAVVRRNK